MFAVTGINGKVGAAVARIQMIEGFDSGLIDFAGRGVHARKGSISSDQAITTLIERQRA